MSHWSQVEEIRKKSRELIPESVQFTLSKFEKIWIVDGSTLEAFIVDYGYFQSQNICSIASGAVESTVKQTSLMFPESKILGKTEFCDRRLKISERTCPHLAQWKVENVPQVLKHRCAYLNNSLSIS